MLSAVRWPNPYGSKNVDDIGLDRSDESRPHLMRAEDLQIRRAGKKAASRASPGINVAFPDLVSEGDVSLQALVELSQRQLSLG